MNKCGENLCTKKERDILELDSGPTPDILGEEYIDMHEGIQSEILSNTRFDENSYLSTTYLGKPDRFQNSKIKVEESSPRSEQGHTLGKLLDGMECQILLDTGASKSFMSKSYYNALQVTLLFTQVCIKNTENSGRKLVNLLVYYL